MTGLGFITVPLAYNNYQNAIKRYDDLVEYKEGLQAAMRAYNIGKYDDYLLRHLPDSRPDYMTEEEWLNFKLDHDLLYKEVEEKPNDIPAGLLWAPVLRVGNLVGKMFRCQASVVLTNMGTETIHIKTLQLQTFIFEMPVKVFSIDVDFTWDPMHPIDVGQSEVMQSVSVYQPIKPGETLEVILPGGVSGLGDKNSELRDLICKASGKKLITSCPKVTITDGITGDMICWWGEDEKVLANHKTFYTLNKPGVLRYCGESFYPSDPE